jgi:uncharacterized protein with gpF-like domain
MTTIHDKIVLKLQQEKAKNLMPVIVNPDIPRTDANKMTTAYHLPRIRQDIKSWRDAILEAEMPYVPYRVKMQLIFEDTALNGHVKACVQKRKNLTLLKEFAVQDEKDNKNENWTRFFKKKWFSDLINYILDAQFYGFSYINWTGISNNKLDGVHIIRRQFISPDRNKITSYPYSPTGVDLMDNDIADWTMYVDTPSENGKSPCGYGLYYIAAMYEIILRNLLGQNADFTELFAQPVRWAKSTKREGIEYDMLEQALVNMGSSAYIITDPQDEITLLGGGSIGTGYQSYDNLEARCEKKISKVLLGHADAMDSVPGKLGSGQNKNNPVEMALAEVETTDNQFCENVINDIFIPKLRNLGFNIPANLFFHFSNNKEKDEVVDKEDDRISKAAVFVKTFFDAGMEVDIDWLSERFNIPIKKAEVIANNNQESGASNIPPYNRNNKKSIITLNPKNPYPAIGHPKNCSCGQHTLGSFKATNKTGTYIPDEVVDALYNKTGIKYSYQLFQNISEDLQAAVRKAFGKHLVRNQEPGVNPKENLYYMMEANTFEFSAAKTAAEIAKGNELLHIDPNQTRQDFQSKLDDMNLLYNEDYLRTEYSTAYATCLNGAQYADRIKDKDLFPYVRWNQIDRPTKREEHEELDGMTFRIDELECIPPVDWNCGCSLEYLEDSDVDESDVSNMSDMEDVLKDMKSTNSKYDNYYDQVKDTGFFDNQYKSMQVFDMAAAYDGLPATFNFEDQDLEQIKNMNPNDFDNIEIQDRDSQFVEKILPDVTINDYSNRTLQLPQYELSQSMKNTAEFVSTITKNPDEVFLSKSKLTYVKFYNDKGQVRSMYADAKLSKDGIKINRWGSLDDADRLRKQLLIHKK